MLKYKNKYATKAISVFGEPQLSIIKRFDLNEKNKKVLLEE